MRTALIISLFVLFSNAGRTQTTCTTPGQLPSTAFPVCGTTTFNQTNVPLCQTHNLFVPGCSGSGTAMYADKNPFWYKFTCYTSGTLGFVITPANLSDDYDWQLYDITGKSPDAVFTDQSIVILGNWSGSSGTTGASAAGVNFIQCASDPAANEPTFSRMPQLIAGHEYLLLVSHYTDTQSGYSLSFGGGTAVITDPSRPGLKNAEANCGGDMLTLSLKKKIKCSSIAADGSDFYISPAAGNVISVTGFNCNNGFDSDSLTLRLNQFLPPGNYTLHIRNGSDGNTLLDICDNAIATTETVNFTVLPKAPTPLDSMTALKCSPQSLTLVFQKPILCSSIAGNASDFVINGSYAAGIASLNTGCTGTTGVTKSITLNLSQPLQVQGNFVLQLRRGSDGNTLLNECGEETPVGSFISFSVKDTVNADFTYAVNYGCTQDIVDFSHSGSNGVNSWRWNLDAGQQSTSQNPTATYSIFTPKNIQLIVTNGLCSDTTSKVITLENYIKADFNVFEDNCPNEPVPFTSTSVGKIVQHDWTFGDGTSGTGANPVHVYSTPGGTRTFTVNYTATDSFGCSQTVSKPIKVYTSCVLDVPNAFTPNTDGHNDFLYPLNAVKAVDLEFSVYNRWGQLMFKSTNWKIGWDGRVGGKLQPSGAYVWMLKYTDRDTQKAVFRKGTAMLIR